MGDVIKFRATDRHVGVEREIKALGISYGGVLANPQPVEHRTHDEILADEMVALSARYQNSLEPPAVPAEPPAPTADDEESG